MSPGASRRRSRRLALQALYEWDTVGHDCVDSLARLAENGNVERESGDFSFASQLIDLVTENRDRLDRIILGRAPSWPIDQMATVDRNILRIAISEMVWDLAPPKATINEAVDLAKAYGGDSSARFVNGVLGAALAELRPANYSSEAQE